MVNLIATFDIGLVTADRNHSYNAASATAPPAGTTTAPPASESLLISTKSCGIPHLKSLSNHYLQHIC